MVVVGLVQVQLYLLDLVVSVDLVVVVPRILQSPPPAGPQDHLFHLAPLQLGIQSQDKDILEGRRLQVRHLTVAAVVEVLGARAVMVLDHQKQVVLGDLEELFLSFHQLL